MYDWDRGKNHRNILFLFAVQIFKPFYRNPLIWNQNRTCWSCVGRGEGLGLHISLDVLSSWTDQGSCSPSVYCMISSTVAINAVWNRVFWVIRLTNRVFWSHLCESVLKHLFVVFYLFHVIQVLATYSHPIPWPPIRDGKVAQLVEPCAGCRGAGRRATSPSKRAPWPGGAAPARQRSDNLSTIIFRIWRKNLFMLWFSKERQNTILRRSALSKSEPLRALEAANMSNELKVIRSKIKESRRRSIFF